MPSPPAFRAILAERSLVQAYFRRRCASPEDAEDLAQEALCSALAAYSKYRGEAALSTWLYGICAHTYASWAREGARTKRLSLALEKRAALELQGPAEPERLALGLALEEALEKLNPSEAFLVGRYYFEGAGVEALARELDCPEGTVKYRLFLVRGRLRAILA